MKKLTREQNSMASELRWVTCGKYDGCFFNRGESPDFIILSAITRDLNTAGGCVVHARQARAEFGLSEKDCNIERKEYKNISFETGERYPVYIVNVILWKKEERWKDGSVLL